MSEKEQTPKHFGFKLTSLTPDFLGKVLGIYGSCAGNTSGVAQFAQQISIDGDGITEQIRKELQQMGCSDRRIGSTIEPTNSKLRIKLSPRNNLFIIRFVPNLDSDEKDPAKKDAAEKMEANFETQIDEFLASSGIGVQLKE
jgi:hypothetical protein